MLEKTASSLAQEKLEKKRLEEEEQEQREQKKSNERKKWFTKCSLIVIASGIGLGLSFVIYKVGKPTYDEYGNVIEDEFSHLPYYEKTFKRLRRELNYFTKV